jgi:hypothetical protein
MADFQAHVPISAVSNPILLWLFAHGWEQPSWGHLPVNQVALGLILQDLGSRVADRASREQIQAIAGKIVAHNAQAVLHETSGG